MRLSRSNFMAPRVSCFNFLNDTKFPRMRTYCMVQMEGGGGEDGGNGVDVEGKGIVKSVEVKELLLGGGGWAV